MQPISTKQGMIEDICKGTMVPHLEQNNALPCGMLHKLWSYMLIQGDIRIDNSLKTYILICLLILLHSAYNIFFDLHGTSRHVVPRGWDEMKLKAPQACACM